MSDLAESLAALLAKFGAAPDPLITLRGRETLAPKEARYAASVRLSRAAALAPKLYTHQARAIDLILGGENAVLATSTASGKTLAFALPAIEQALASGRSTLFIYPTKALMNDQRRTLLELALKAGLPASAVPEPYSSIDKEDRAAVKDDARNLRFLIMTPESVDQSLLGYHKTWGPFLANLGLVVLDEIHYYNGYFGINMAYMLRRLRLVQSYYSKRPPNWLAASATVGRPRRTAETLVGAPFREVGAEHDGAPAGEKTIFFAEAAPGKLLNASVALTGELAALAKKEKTGVVVNFMPTRSLVERAILEARRRFKNLGESITSYRAGYGEREMLEEGLRDGKLQAVFSTNALEAGIDYGSLTVAVMTGFPGTASEMTQRSGRVGRKSEGAVILLGGDNPFDQYYLSHPKDYLKRIAEFPPLMLENDLIAARHLACALKESRVLGGAIDYAMFPPNFKAVADLPAAEEGDEDSAAAILESTDPYRRFQLRTFAGREVALMANGYQIGTIDTRALLNEAYPGGIYLHRGKRYRVRDAKKYGAQALWVRTVELDAMKQPWTTRPERRFGISRKKELQAKGSRKAGAKLLEVFAYQRVPGFREIGPGHDRSVSYPEPIFWAVRSLAVALEPPDASDAGLHALEHLMRSVVPLRTPFESSDFGSCCDAKAVYVYDAVPGGAGLAQTVFKRLKACVKACIETLESCGCKEDAGCPRCLHAGRCERENDALSKAKALAAAQALLAALPDDEVEPAAPEEAPTPAPAAASAQAPRNFYPSIGARIRYPDLGEGEVLARRFKGGQWRDTIIFGSSVKTLILRLCAQRVELLSGEEGQLCPAGCSEDLLPRDVRRCPRCKREIE